MSQPYRLFAALATVLGFFSAGVQAEIRTEVVDYTVDGEAFTGYLAWDDSVDGERPGILVVHEWWGHNDFARTQAEKLAAQGYTAFALDMYGSGRLADHPEDAQGFMQALMGDMAVVESRFRAAMELLQDHDTVDPDRIAAQGYCMGGAVVLNMARRGLDLDGVVSLHGSLGGDAPEPGSIRARIQVYTGGADPFVPADQVAGFVEQMQAAEADFTLVSYPGAVHSFTSPEADANGERFGLPLAYDAHADEHSWRGLSRFYRDIFSD